jgi:hypothetical protein
VLVAATASTIGDSDCALAWGTRLAGEAGADAAAGVVACDDADLGTQPDTEFVTAAPPEVPRRDHRPPPTGDLRISCR